MAKLSGGQKQHQENLLKTLSLSDFLLDSIGNRSKYGMGKSNATQWTGDHPGSLLRCWILCDCLGGLFAFSLLAMPATAQLSPNLLAPQVSLPAVQVSLPAVQVSLPSTQVSLPAPQVSLPAAQVSLPAAQVSLPSTQVSLPAAQVSLPAVQVSLPGVQVSLPSTQVSLPAVQVNLPSTQVSLPGTQVSLPGVQVGLPSTQVSLPSTQVSLPGVQVGLSGVQVGLSGAQVSLPGTQISLPAVQVSPPGVQVSPSGTQVSLPTASNQMQPVNVSSNQSTNPVGTVNLQPNQPLPVLEPSVNSNPESISTSQPSSTQLIQLPQTVQSSLPTQANSSLPQTQVLLKINGSVSFNPSQPDPVEAGSSSSKFQPPDVQLIDPLHDSTVSANQAAQTCSVRHRGNNFVTTGRGGITPDPTEALNQTLVWQRENSSQKTENTSLAPRYAQREDVPQVSSPLVEATALRRNADGTVSLVAEPEAVRSLNTIQARQISSVEEANNDATPK